MIFIKLKEEDVNTVHGWIPTFRKIQPDDFKYIDIRIFGVVYTEWSEEFEEALLKDTMYDRLLYQPKGKNG